MGPDLHFGFPRCSVDAQTADIPLQELSSPPEYPAPSLEHVLNQSHNKDDIKTIPVMYDLPENFSSKKVYMWLVSKLKFNIAVGNTIPPC